MRSKASVGTFRSLYASVVIPLLLVWGVAVACEAPQPATDARIDRIETQIEALGSTVERIDGQVTVLSQEPTATPSPTRTPTPSPISIPTATPPPSPGPTLEDITALVDERVTAAITAIPTQQSIVIQADDETVEMLDRVIDAKVSEAVAESIAQLPSPTVLPGPQPTPGPTLAEVEELIASRLSKALALVPTPTSLDELRALVDERIAAATGPLPTPTRTAVPPSPTLTPGGTGGQVSGASVAALSEDIFLTVDPGHGLAGHDVRFTLKGVRPWQPVEVEFADPRDGSVEWITEDEARFLRTNGRPVTKQTKVADGSGQATWIRIGTQDVEGVWSVRVTLDGETSTVRYPVSQLQLPSLEPFTSGIEFRKYKGSVSDAYISALVPSSLAVDIQAHLGWVVERLDDELGIRSSTIPDIYLTGNRGLLETVSDATGVGLGFEDGYFVRGGPQPGIYMRADFLRSALMGTLTHEYVHLVLNEISGGADLPAWLNEGLATYLEYELGLRGVRPNAARRELYRSTDTARSSVVSGPFLPLTGLESQSRWMAQTDEAIIRLMYSEAHMAVRLLTEDHGADAPVRVMLEIAGGDSLPGALQTVTGSTYAEFRDRFVSWLQSWEDPARAAIGQYVQELDDILAAESLIFARRSAYLDSGLSLEQSRSVSSALVADAQELQARLRGLTPGESLAQLHDDASEFLASLVEMLTLERDYLESSIESKRLEAGRMIPELFGRVFRLQRDLSSIQFNYQLSPAG